MTHPEPTGHDVDPGLKQQEAATDEEDHEELDPAGHLIASEITHQELIQGVELEDDPWEVHVQNHPTPDRPSGRLEP